LRFSQQCGLVDVIDERPLAVDLDHRDPFAVPGLEVGDAGDVDLLVLDRQPFELLLGALTEAAALRRVQDDARDRARA
jgi:hypothetical protein